MSVDKVKYWIDRAVIEASHGSVQIWGFIVSEEDGEVECQPFSSHNLTPYELAERVASAARAMIEGEQQNARAESKPN